MIIFFQAPAGARITKSQSFLFDAPVRVAGHVRHDGTLVAPHTRIQKVAARKPAAPQHQAAPDLFGNAPAPSHRTPLDKFIDAQGGQQSLAGKLRYLTQAQRETLFARMAQLSRGKTASEVAAMFHDGGLAAPQGDLFAAPVVAEEPAETSSTPAAAAKPAPFARDDIIEFKDRTGKFVQARVTAVEAWQGTLMATVVDVPKRSPFKVGISMRRTFDSVRLAHRPEVVATPEKPVLPPPPAPTPEPAATRMDAGSEGAAAVLSVAAPWGVPAGITKPARRAINARVAALVADGQTDLDLMRQYSGNGGCGDSLNEFYTDPDVAAAQWAAIARLGITGGTALEPSCATGVYLHTAPEGFRVTGVEMDPISSACAQALHGDRHEIRGGTSLERFARSDGGRQFNVTVGNPPYGPRGSLAKDDKPDLKTAESYFIDTAVDKTAAGGIISLVIPASVLNNKNGRAFRERILRKAEFLGAQRMPNSAFEASHTDVTADVLWLRKRPDDVAGALMTVPKATLKTLGVWDDEFLAGTYFEGRGAANLLGTVGTAMRSFGEVYTVTGSMSGVAGAIGQFEPHPVGTTPTVHDVLEALAGDDKATKRALGGAMVRPYADGKAGDTKVVDGVTYVLQGKPLRWHSVDEVLAHDSVTDAKPVADMIERAMAGEEVDHAALTEAVQAYIARHGIPAKSKHLTDAADHDRVLHRLIGAVDHTGRMSDVVTGRQARAVTSSLETAAATLAAEHEDGTFTAAELAERSGKPLDEVEDALLANSAYAFTAGGRWATMDQYLTGDLWPKLDAARAAADVSAKGVARRGSDTDADYVALAAKLAMQVTRLDEAIGAKSLDDVEVMLNSAFLPTDVLAAWLTSRVTDFRAKNPDSSWARDMKDGAVKFDGGLYKVTGGMWNDNSLLEKYLNRTGVKKDDMPQVDRMNEEFRAWLLSSDYRDEVEELYNRKFRGFVEPKWSDAPIEIPGLNPDVKLNAYHWSSLRWAMARGAGIIADDVGLGKTPRGLMLARLLKMTGRAKKPTFVVPKSVLANWVAEAEKFFPGSHILVIGETYSRDKAGNLKSRPDTPVERNRKYHDLTQNDYDFVFISQPSFNELDVDPITKGEYLDQDFWVQRGDKLGNAGDKQVKKVREGYKQAVADREFRKHTDAIYFNDLGIDAMLVDEAHCFPAGTLVDGKPIEAYRAGDKVRSFDHATGGLVHSMVLNLQVRTPRSLFKVKVSTGVEIVCTGKHPFFTPDGYVFAEDLRCDDTIYSLKQEPVSGHESAGSGALSEASGGLSALRQDIRIEQGAGLETADARGDGVLLHEVVRDGVHLDKPEGAQDDHGGIDQEHTCLCGAPGSDACRRMEPDVRPGASCASLGNQARGGLEASRAGRQRAAHAGAAAQAVGCAAVRAAGLGGGVHPEHGDAGRVGLPVALQVGHSVPSADADRRSGRRIAQLAYPAGPGPEEGGAFEFARVVDVEVFQPTGDGRFGGLCPDGFVYNIEVERTHTYIVGGVLVHNSYKNLYAARARFGESPKFLGGQGQSNRAFDLSFKAKWLREQHGGAGVYGLTATPTKNSPLEVYSMLSYIAPEAFERIGIRNSEEFLDRYCVFKTENVLGTNGEISEALVTEGFKNLDELREIMGKYIMRRKASDVGLKLPEAHQEMHLVNMTPEQSSVYGDLRAQLAEAGKKDSTGDAHVFSIMDKMAKAAMDLELLDAEKHAGQGRNSPKYQEAAKHIVAGAKNGGQVVFCESVASHAKIADALVAAGIPRERIAILNATEASSSAQRQNISDRFNDGRLDVVIGNKVMEEGVNLQKRTTDIHHLDTPWDPATLQQRNGRGVRQGNVNEAIKIHTYLARGSFDGYRYQSMRAKRDWSESLWNGGDRVDNLAREGVFSREDMMVMMSADPEAERAKMAADKDAAMQRLTADRTTKAAGEFVRFQSLKRSFAGLKNRDTKAGARLRAQIDAAKIGLQHNKYFHAKDVLDSNDEVLIHPGTGDVVTKGQGYEVTESEGPASKWVVTGVDPVHQTVSMRRYADTTGHKGVTVPMAKLATGTKAFRVDDAAEAADVSHQFEEQAAANLNSLKDWEQVAKMPSAVLEANHDLIQRQIKEGSKAYKFKMPYGDVAMINRATGKPEMVNSYDHAGRYAETHDYMLPTDANREKAIQAWIDARRESKIATKFTAPVGRNKRHGTGTYTPARKYEGAGYPNEHVNPGKRIADFVSGSGGYGATSPLVKEAQARLNVEQMDRIRHAKNIGDAIDAALVMGSVTGTEKGVARIPRRVLMLLWAKAKRLGVLGDKASTHIAMSGYGQPARHDAYAYAGSHDKTVQTMLEQMAAASGHRDVAVAMARGGADVSPRRDHEEAYRSMESLTGGDLTTSLAALQMALRHAQNGGFADKLKGDVHRPSGGYYGATNWSHVNENGKKLGDTLRERITQHENQIAAQAAKEAA